MKLFGLDISISREKQPAVAKDATEYALAAGFWPDEGPMNGGCLSMLIVCQKIGIESQQMRMVGKFSYPRAEHLQRIYDDAAVYNAFQQPRVHSESIFPNSG